MHVFKMTDIREITSGLRDISAAKRIDHPRRGLKFSSQTSVWWLTSACNQHSGIQHL